LVNHNRYSHSIIAAAAAAAIEQVTLRQSTERHHSILDWLSRESYKIVRSIQHMTLTNTHSPITHHHQSSQSSINRYSLSLSLSLSILDDHHHIEQVPLQQSTERHHSIIDWLSRESRVLVRSIQHMTLTTTHSPINHQHQSSQSSINRYSLSLSLSHSILDDHHHTLNRDLNYNQLSGTIPSSIGSLKYLEDLYVQSAQQANQLLTLKVVD